MHACALNPLHSMLLLTVSHSTRSLIAHFLRPDFAPAGNFSSSLPMLNKVQHSIIASAAANWANDVPTDITPQQAAILGILAQWFCVCACACACACACVREFTSTNYKVSI